MIKLLNLEKKIEKLSLDLTNDNNIKEYSKLMERFENLGGYTYKKTIEVMINKFGFTINEEVKNVRINNSMATANINYKKELTKIWDKLDEYFNEIINVKYTSNMESDLDDVAEGKSVWYEILHAFWDSFKPTYDKALKAFGANVNIAGFRKGKAPSSVIEKYIGKDRIKA